MTTRPINLADWQVRAALGGRLSLVLEPLAKQPPENVVVHRYYGPDAPRPELRHTFGWMVPEAGDLWPCNVEDRITIRCAVGDRLWVREAWRVGAWREVPWPRSDEAFSAEVAIDYVSDNLARREWLIGDNPEKMMRLADQSREDANDDGRFKMDAEFQYRWSPGQSPCRIRTSTHMPRWASRLTMTVTDVRVQRVQDIVEDKAKAVGVLAGDWPDRPVCTCDDDDCAACSHLPSLHLPALMYKWNARYAKRGLAWDANPWVTATTVTVHRCNIDQMEARNG